jgi:hypothetical protein
LAGVDFLRLLIILQVKIPPDELISTRLRDRAFAEKFGRASPSDIQLARLLISSIKSYHPLSRDGSVFSTFLHSNFFMSASSVVKFLFSSHQSFNGVTEGNAKVRFFLFLEARYRAFGCQGEAITEDWNSAHSIWPPEKDWTYGGLFELPAWRCSRQQPVALVKPIKKDDLQYMQYKSGRV